MSFSLTTPQVRAGTKTVTRRLGWKFLQPGDRLMACVKCMGRKNGEPLERIREIEVVSKRREVLGNLIFSPVYGAKECAHEGFPEMTPDEFLQFFCRTHKGSDSETMITRIEFRYVS